MKRSSSGSVRGGGNLAAELENARRQAAEVASALATIAEKLPSDDGQVDLARRVRAVYRARRIRDAMLPSGSFVDPAWDMLLDLFLADLEGRQTSVTSVCVASGAPLTTALRWIERLAQLGAILKMPDPTDVRRSFVSITPEMRDKMRVFFEGDDCIAI